MKDHSEIVKKRKEEKKNGTAEPFGYDAGAVVKRKQIEKSIGFDTFSTDFNDVSTMITTAYGGWQDQNYMKKNKIYVVGMIGRLNAIKNYRDKYSVDIGFDVDSAIEYYNSALDNWDKQAGIYGEYKDADAYGKAKRNWELDYQFSKKDEEGNVIGGLTFEEVQAEKKKYKSGSEEYEYLSNYTGYTDLDDFDKAIAWEKGVYTNSKGEKANTGDKFKIYPSEEDIEKASRSMKGNVTRWTDMFSAENTNKKLAKKLVNGEEITSRDKLVFTPNEEYIENLENARNERKLVYGTTDYYSEYFENDDFEEGSQYKSTITEPDNPYKMFGDAKYEYINNQQENIRAQLDGSARVDWAEDYKSMGYDKLYPNEVKLYNYFHYLDQQNGTDLADNYLKN